MSNYTLYNQDCFDVFPEIPEGSIDLVLCDPPYGTTACKWDTVLDLELMWEHLKRICKKNAAMVFTASQPFTCALGASNLSMLRYSWTWKKHHATGHLNARKRPMKQTEDILVFFDKQSTYIPQGVEPVNQLVTNSDSDCRRGGNNKTSTVSGGLKKHYLQHGTGYPRDIIELPSCNSNKQHPTQKPVALMEYMIKTYTNEGETVLDFCMGSGTTGVACGNLNRNFIGIEKDTEHGYFQIAEKRISEAYA